MINGSGTVLPQQGADWVHLLKKGSDIHLTFMEPYAADTIYAEFQNHLTGGFASSYTSWGPTWELDVYPTVGAPGGNILSTYLLDQGGYAVLSGTSMATPFVAAAYALVGQVRGTFDPAGLRNVVTSHARAQLWNDGTGTLEEVAPVPQQGTGLIQAYDAAFSTALLTTSSLSFNDTYRSVGNATFTIRNMDEEPVTYKFGNSPALSMYTLSIKNSFFPDYFPNQILAASARLDFSQNSVEVPPKGRVDITVIPILSSMDNARGTLPVYSGFVTINGTNGEHLTIPYLGVFGSMTNEPVVDPLESTMLGYGTEDNTVRRPAPDNITFSVPYPIFNNTFDPDDPTGKFPVNYYNFPMAEVLLDLGTRILRADVVPLSANYTGPITMVLGEDIAGSVYGYPQTYLSRTSTSVVFTGLLDDGTAVPEGDYALNVRALRLFGDPERPEDYDTMVMVPFTLIYWPNTTKAAIDSDRAW